MDSCRSCALPHKYMGAHEVVTLSRLDSSWHSSFPNSWHPVDCLPDIHDCLENWPIFVVGPESSLSLDPLSLAIRWSGHQWGDGQIQGWPRWEDRTKLRTASFFKADNLHRQDSNAVIKDRRDRRRAGEQGLHIKHIYIINELFLNQGMYLCNLMKLLRPRPWHYPFTIWIINEKHLSAEIPCNQSSDQSILLQHPS